MKQHIQRYFLYLGCVLAAMVVYRLTIVPIIEPKQTGRGSVALINDMPSSIDAWWQDRFPAEAWQNAGPTVLSTQMVTLLCKDWKPVGTNSLQLSKMTMLVPYAKISKSHRDAVSQSKLAKEDDNLVIIDASEGAIIQFQEAPNWLSGNMPPIVGGRLVGNIRIYNSPGADTSEKLWELKTREVRVERRRFWTTDAVELNYAGGQIRGRDLSIYLKQDLLSPNKQISAQQNQWGMFDHMDLIYVDRVQQQLPPGGLWPSMSLSSNQDDRLDNTKLPATLELTCGGRFRFDFNRTEATLSDRVRLTHRLGDLNPDQLWCHQLALTFDTSAEKPVDANAPSKANEVWIGPMKLTKVDALGSDANGPMQVEPLVRLEAPNIETSVHSKRVEIKLARNEISIWGSLTSNSPKTVVRLTRSGYELLAPSIQYLASSNLKQLGTLLAKGPGEFRTPQNTEIGRWFARWEDELNVVPVDRTHKIGLLGRALLESPTQGHLAGGVIECWLLPSQDHAQSPNAADVSSDRPTIEQAHAIGNVQLAAHSRNLLVNVEELWLKMLYPKVGQGDAQSGPMTGLQLDGYFGPTPPPPVRQPQTPPPAAPSQPLAAQSSVSTAAQSVPASPQLSRLANASSVPATGPGGPGQSITYVPPATAPEAQGQATQMAIKITGQTLNSKVVWFNDQTWIDDLTIEGPITITRSSAQPNPQQVWEIRGSQLRTATNAAGQADLQIVGQPAVVAMGQGGLAGNLIRLDQKLGLIWMDQPGFFSLPAEVLKTSLPNQSIEWLKPLACQWEGRMLFDGKTARIEGRVQLSGQLRTENQRKLLVDGNCNSLEIHLSQPIDLNKPEVTSAGLEAIVLQDSVVISISQLDEQDRLYSRERIAVPKLVYEYARNRLIGEGPGWIRSRHPAQSPSSSDTSPSTLQGLHLKFRDVLDAKLDTRAIAVKGQVRLVMGPISSLEEDLDMDLLRYLSPGQMELSSDLMQIYDLSSLGPMRTLTPPTGIPWEFKANGNVVFENVARDAATSGTAHELTFTQPKDLLVIKSDGKNAAFVKRVPAAQSSIKELNVYVRSATINIRTMQVEAEPVAVEIPLNPINRENQPATQSIPQTSIPNPRDLNPFFRPKQ